MLHSTGLEFLASLMDKQVAVRHIQCLVMAKVSGVCTYWQQKMFSTSKEIRLIYQYGYHFTKYIAGNFMTCLTNEVSFTQDKMQKVT
mgnify:CR=1 FL=1